MTTENTQGESAAPVAPSAPEMVELHEASDEDLAAFLESAEQGQEEDQELTQQPPVAKAAPTAPASSETQDEAVSEPEQKVESQEDVGKRLEKLQRQLDGLELITKRRTSELAEVKTRLNGYLQAANAQIEEKMAANPVEGTKDLLRIREAEEHLSRVEAEERNVQVARANQEAVLRNVDLDETPIDAIAEVFLADGLPPTVVEQFKANPWMVPATTTIQAAKRAKAENYLRVLVPEFRKLQNEVKKLRNGGQEALRKIDAVAKEIPGITAASGGVSATATDSDSIPVHQMSDAQLEALLRKLG